MIPSQIKIKILALRRINAALGSKGLSRCAARRIFFFNMQIALHIENRYQKQSQQFIYSIFIQFYLLFDHVI